MENSLLKYSYDELADMLIEALTLRNSMLTPAIIQHRMNVLLNQITGKLTSKQYERFQFSTDTFEQVTKSKKLHDIYAQWQTEQKSLQTVLDVEKHIGDLEYTVKQKRTMFRPSLVYSTTPTMYDIMMNRIAKHRINSAQASQLRTKQMNRNALRLCK